MSSKKRKKALDQPREIVKTHIECDQKNYLPCLVYTDETGVEWVEDGEGRYLIQKEKSWYFQTED